VILATLTSGCTSVRAIGSCPDLPPPPEAAVIALQTADNPVVDEWAIDLANHYDKLDVCRGR
jgi:hypothetical protein